MRRVGAYLHDELDGADEEAQELEDEIFLFFLHLIHTKLFPPRQHLGGGETVASAGLEHVLGDSACTAGLGSLFLFLVDVLVLGLELLDERVHVLVFFFLVTGLGSGAVVLLLVEAAGGHIVTEMVWRSGASAGAGCRGCGRHWALLVELTRAYQLRCSRESGQDTAGKGISRCDAACTATVKNQWHASRDIYGRDWGGEELGVGTSGSLVRAKLGS